MQRALTRTLTLQLCGHTASLNLAEMVAFDPSAEDGAIPRATVRRGVESCACHGTPLAHATSAPNHDPGHFHPGSIEHVGGHEIPSGDIVWASFPCQP